MNQIFNLQSPWSSQGQMERFLNIMLSVGSSAAQLTSTCNSLCVLQHPLLQSLMQFYWIQFYLYSIKNHINSCFKALSIVRSRSYNNRLSEVLQNRAFLSLRLSNNLYLMFSVTMWISDNRTALLLYLFLSSILKINLNQWTWRFRAKCIHIKYSFHNIPTQVIYSVVVSTKVLIICIKSFMWISLYRKMLECDSRMMVAFIHSGLIKPQRFYTGFNGKQLL